MSQLLIVVAAAVLISALAALMETVFASMTHSYVAARQAEGRRAGTLLGRLMEQPDQPLTALVTVATVAQVGGATVAGAMAHEALGSEGLAVFAALLTLTVLLAAELLPRAVGGAHWEVLAAPTAYLLYGLVLLLRPLLVALGALRRLLAAGQERPPTVSRAELEIMAAIGLREGTLAEAEWEVVSNVINLDEVTVGSVMTPRTSIVAVPVDATVEEAKDLMLEEGHLRLPVFDGTLDRIVGILLARDLWRADREGLTRIRQILRPPTFVPDSKPADEMIREMRSARIKMSIVLDEFGGTAGLVTLEDLLEEIVGEIHDEHEQDPLPFEEQMEGEVRIRGDVPLWEINERYGLELPEDVYETIGGFVFGQLGRIAEEGDEVQADHARFRVVAMDGRRIERIAYLPGEQTPD